MSVTSRCRHEFDGAAAPVGPDLRAGWIVIQVRKKLHWERGRPGRSFRNADETAALPARPEVGPYQQ